MSPHGGGPGGAPRADLARTTFAVLFIGLLIAASLWIALPFLGPLLWATMVVVATWGILERVQDALGGRRMLAVGVMSVGLLLVLVVPLTLAVLTIVDNAQRLAEWTRLATTWTLPEAPPSWLTGLPVVGSMVQGLWASLAALGLPDLLPKLEPYAGSLTKWFVAQVGNVGFLLLQFLVTVVIASVLWSLGDEAAVVVRRFAARLAGSRGAAVVDLAGGAIRGVALGVGGTALVQAVIAGLALWIAGIPFTGLLTALTFMLCIAQVGPVPVLVPAALWALFGSGDTGWGIFLLVVAGAVATLDNVLRPLLIRMGAELPLLLIFAGVIGGLLAFGLVGLFVGPLVLAVAWTLLEAWMNEPPEPPPPAQPDWRD